MIAHPRRERKQGSKNLSTQAAPQALTFILLALMSRPGRALIKFGQQYKDHYTTGRTKCLGTLKHGEL